MNTSQVNKILDINAILENRPALFLVDQIDLVGKRTSLDKSTALQILTGKLSRHENSVLGSYLSDDKGRKSIVYNCSNSGHSTLAHEIGHLLGLPHVADQNNLMYRHGKEAIGSSLSDDQCKVLKEKIRKLEK